MAAIALIKMIKATPLLAYRFLCLSRNVGLTRTSISSLTTFFLRSGEAAMAVGSSFKWGVIISTGVPKTNEEENADEVCPSGYTLFLSARNHTGPVCPRLGQLGDAAGPGRARPSLYCSMRPVLFLRPVLL